jgi:hypothetical protein
MQDSTGSTDRPLSVHHNLHPKDVSDPPKDGQHKTDVKKMPTAICLCPGWTSPAGLFYGRGG